MIDWIKYRFALNRAINLRNIKKRENTKKINQRNQKSYDFRNEEFEKGNPIDFLNNSALDGEDASRDREIRILMGEISKLDRDVQELRAMHLLKQADFLGIPYPDKGKSEFWLARREERLTRDGSPEIDTRELLSESGLRELRASIRKERKERFEPWKDRGAFIFGVGGLFIAAGSLIVAGLGLSLRMAEVGTSRAIQPPAKAAADMSAATPPVAPAKAAPAPK